MIDRLVIVGVGLIGGSLSLALKRSGYVREVVGVGRSEANLLVAKERGIIDRYVDAIEDEAVSTADVVFLSVPVETIPPILERLKLVVKPGCLLTDGGSTKRAVARQGDALFNEALGKSALSESGAAFVAGHPIAGTEKSGASAAFSDLYDGKRVILTPTADTPDWAVEKTASMWRATGAKVELMTPETHDAILAAISHLPHAVAFGLVNAVRSIEEKSGESMLSMTAGGFRDFTRIASSDPEMWRDIFLQNDDQVLAALSVYEAQLAELRRLVESRDAEGLADYFRRAKTARDRLVEG